MYDLNWFKISFSPKLIGFSIEYLSFENGDLGDLDEVRCESNRLGISISFWSSGYLGIFIYDYEKDLELLNIITDKKSERKDLFESIEKLL